MTFLPITLLAAALAAILNVWLGIRCGMMRTKEKINMGDGGNENMVARMRAHSNFVENAPFFVLLIAAIELAKGAGNPTWLYWIVIAFFVGRIAHAFGMDGWKPGRPIGALTAMLSLAGLAIYALVLAYSSAAPAAVTAPTQMDLNMAEELPQG